MNFSLSLHDALPIYVDFFDFLRGFVGDTQGPARNGGDFLFLRGDDAFQRGVADSERHHRREEKRSEEHTSELQSRRDLVCRLLLEKKQSALQYFHT